MLPFHRQRKNGNSKKNAKFYKPKIEYTDDGFVVTTLYIRSLGREIKRDHLINYFSTFGRVHNVRIHNKATRSFGFVTFARAESAAKALSQRVHMIGVREIHVNVADSWHQEKPLELSNNHKGSRYVKLPIELTNVTGTHMMDVNDDCLYEIFSLKRVNLMDLCSIAETCTRLKDIALRIFTTAHKSCNLNALNLNTIHEMRRFLISFGSSITDLTIGPSFAFEQKQAGMSARALDLVARYCGETLKSLTIFDYEINQFLGGKLRPLFSRLKKLTIEDGYLLGSGKSLFSKCTELVELKMINVENDEIAMIFENLFPKLQVFKYQKDYEDYDDYNLELFLSRHKNLKAFTLKEFNSDCTSLLPIIAENCKDLETLRIVGRNDNDYPLLHVKALDSVLKLTKLKKLKIKCDDENVTKFVKELPQLSSLKILELWYAQSDTEFIPALTQLKNLNVLRLHYCNDLKNINKLAELEKLTELSIVLRRKAIDEIEFDLVGLVKRLVNLKKLTLGIQTFKMDKKMYVKLVNAIRERTTRVPSPLHIQLRDLDDDVVDLQYDGKSKEIVKLDTVSHYFESDDDDFSDDYSDSDFDPDQYMLNDDDDDDEDFDLDLPPVFLLPFIQHRLFGDTSDSDNDFDEDENEENEVW